MSESPVTVTKQDILKGMASLGIEGGVEVHSSLSSFGNVDGGAETVLDALVAAFPLVVVPAFTWLTWAPPPPGLVIERNGTTQDWVKIYQNSPQTPWSPDMPSHKRIGAIPEALRKRPNAVRSRHPSHSFAAIGKAAAQILATQTLDDCLAPINALLSDGGWVLMLGAKINSCTAVHEAEYLAGRPRFIRWAVCEDGVTRQYHVPMCTGSYPRFLPLLAPVARETKIGNAHVIAWPGRQFLDIIVAAIRKDPAIIVCSPACTYCQDIYAGGPIVKSVP